MKIIYAARTFLLTASIGLAGSVLSLPTAAADAPGKDSAKAKALQEAMTPGEGQKRLEPMIGTFDVTLLVWLNPNKPPLEYKGGAVNSWALGGRYVQTMLVTAMDDGQPFEGIGYYGFDNTSKMYEAAWMDNGSTAISLYRGVMDKSGRSAVLSSREATVAGAKPMQVEMRVSIAESGDHVTQLWGAPQGGKAFKLMELRSVRAKK
jgi:hypothetical protein